MGMEHADARRAEAEHAKGTLVLIGGGASAEGDALGAFVRLAHAAHDGRIVGLTTASGNPAASARAWRADLATAGARQVEIPIVARREDAQDVRIARKIREATGIFLGGGDQVHLIATLGGTPVGEAIREAYLAGAVVCGTSAGAAALTEMTLAGGEIDETSKEVGMYVGPGFGLLGFHAMIDTHFAQRRRLHRLFVAIAQYPRVMGLGLDEDTALVVHGHLGEVRGKGGVTFVDGYSTVAYDNQRRITHGGELTISHLRVGIVGTGHHFDLRQRELVALLAERERAVDGDGARALVAEREP